MNKLKSKLKSFLPLNLYSGYFEDILTQPARQALGQTRRLAKHLDLAQMKPRPDIASNKFCLANLGINQAVLLPEGGRVSVNLSEAVN